MKPNTPNTPSPSSPTKRLSSISQNSSSKSSSKIKKSKTSSSKSSSSKTSSSKSSSKSKERSGKKSSIAHVHALSIKQDNGHVHHSSPSTTIKSSGHKSSTSRDRQSTYYSSKDKSNPKTFIGLDAQSMKCMWEQHDLSSTQVNPEAFTRLAEDVSFKLWELGNNLRIFAQHSGGKLTADVVNDTLKDSNVPPVIGMTEKYTPWHRLDLHGSYYFNSDKNIDLSKEYRNPILIKQSASMELEGAWMSNCRYSKDMEKLWKNLMIAIVLGDEAAYQYAIQTVIINPYVACVFPVLVHKSIEYLTFGCPNDTIKRLIRFLKAIAHNVRCRDVYIESTGILSNLFVCLLFGPASGMDRNNASGNQTNDEICIKSEFGTNNDIDEPTNTDIGEKMSSDDVEQMNVNGTELAVDDRELNETIALLSKNTLVTQYLHRNGKINLKRKFPLAFIEGENRMENIHLMEKYINESLVKNINSKDCRNITSNDDLECSDSKRQLLHSVFQVDGIDKVKIKTESVMDEQEVVGTNSNDNDMDCKVDLVIGFSNENSRYNGTMENEDAHDRLPNNKCDPVSSSTLKTCVIKKTIKSEPIINNNAERASNKCEPIQFEMGMCKDAKLIDEIISVVGILSSRWGVFEYEIIFLFFERLAKFFETISEWTTEDFKFLQRFIQVLSAMGDTAFRELTLYFPAIPIDKLSETMLPYWNFCGIYICGRKDIFLYEYLSEVCGDGLNPFSVYLADRIRKRQSRWLIEKQRREDNVLRIPNRPRLKTIPRRPRTSRTKRSPQIDAIFPERAPKIKLKPSKRILFKYTGCTPVFIKPDPKPLTHHKTAADKKKPFASKIVICKKKFLKRLVINGLDDSPIKDYRCLTI